MFFSLLVQFLWVGWCIWLKCSAYPLLQEVPAATSRLQLPTPLATRSMPQKDLTTPHQLQVEKLPLQEIFVGPAAKFFNEFLEIQVFIGPPDCFFSSSVAYGIFAHQYFWRKHFGRIFDPNRLTSAVPKIAMLKQEGPARWMRMTTSGQKPSHSQKDGMGPAATADGSLCLKSGTKWPKREERGRRSLRLPAAAEWWL